jgi:hypothetical protein
MYNSWQYVYTASGQLSCVETQEPTLAVTVVATRGDDKWGDKWGDKCVLGCSQFRGACACTMHDGGSGRPVEVKGGAPWRSQSLRSQVRSDDRGPDSSLVRR